MNIDSVNAEAVSALLRGLQTLMDDIGTNSTKIYDGLVVSLEADSTGKWDIQYNGKIHSLKPYGSIQPSVGKMVKVFIPSGNQNLAFFM